MFLIGQNEMLRLAHAPFSCTMGVASKMDAINLFVTDAVRFTLGEIYVECYGRSRNQVSPGLLHQCKISSRTVYQ
jgi:hypothetical protein